MKTLQIPISDELLSLLESVSTKKEAFVIEAIREKIEKEKKSNLKELLTEGYQATYDEDISIAKDFEETDFENL